jgi:hypothetical protein
MSLMSLGPLQFDHGSVTALRNAPDDDEPLTQEDLEALREAEEDVAQGRVVS